MSALYAAVQEKNLQFFYDYRAVNGCYIYGGRKAPFGVVNFPAEFAKLRKMIENRERRIWDVAQGKPVPATIDDSDTGEFATVKTNVNEPDQDHDARTRKPETFTLPEGYAINLFASEVEFPDLEDPVSMTFDAKGRLWVTTMPSYPMYLPGTKPNDKVLILEDTNGDGKADRCKVFADGLHVPTGIELGDGGVYVSQMPNLMFLKDTDGDDRADIARADHARLRHGRFASCDARLYLGPGRGAALAGGDVPLLAGRDAVRPAAVQRGGHLPLGAEDQEVRRLRLVRLRQPLGPLHRPLGPELRGRRLGRGQLLRHGVLGPGRSTRRSTAA